MKKIFLMALVAMAILAGCKKKTTNNDPVTPEPKQLDSSAWDIVVFLSDDVLKYTNMELVEVTDGKETVVPCKLAPELANESASTSLKYFNSCYSFTQYVPLTKINPYKSSTAQMLYYAKTRSYKIKLTRNQTALPTDTVDLYCLAAIGAEPTTAGMRYGNNIAANDENGNSIREGYILLKGVQLYNKPDSAEIFFEKAMRTLESQSMGQFRFIDNKE